jgi:hypothetical protein
MAVSVSKSAFPDRANLAANIARAVVANASVIRMLAASPKRRASNSAGGIGVLVAVLNLAV